MKNNFLTQEYKSMKNNRNYSIMNMNLDEEINKINKEFKKTLKGIRQDVKQIKKDQKTKAETGVGQKQYYTPDDIKSRQRVSYKIKTAVNDIKFLFLVFFNLFYVLTYTFESFFKLFIGLVDLFVEIHIHYTIVSIIFH